MAKIELSQKQRDEWYRAYREMQAIADTLKSIASQSPRAAEVVALKKLSDDLHGCANVFDDLLSNKTA